MISRNLPEVATLLIVIAAIAIMVESQMNPDSFWHVVYLAAVLVVLVAMVLYMRRAQQQEAQTIWKRMEQKRKQNQLARQSVSQRKR